MTTNERHDMHRTHTNIVGTHGVWDIRTDCGYSFWAEDSTGFGVTDKFSSIVALVDFLRGLAPIPIHHSDGNVRVGCGDGNVSL